MKWQSTKEYDCDGDFAGGVGVVGILWREYAGNDDFYWAALIVRHGEGRKREYLVRMWDAVAQSISDWTDYGPFKTLREAKEVAHAQVVAMKLES